MTKRFIVVEIDDESLTDTQKSEGGALEVVRSALDHFDVSSSMVELMYDPLKSLHEVDPLAEPKPEGRHCCCPPKGYSGLWAAGPCPVHMGLRARSFQRDATFEKSSFDSALKS